MTNYLIVGGVVIIAVLLIIAIIKGLFRKTMSVILSLITMLAFWYVNVFGNPLTQARNTVIKSGVEQATTVAKTKSPDIVTNVKDSINSAKESITNLLPGAEKTEKNESYFVERLTGSEQSSVDENGQPVGSAKYGATFILGDLDEHGRATFAHILVSDSQEPGQNGEARPGKIFVDPAGWKNYKFKNAWVNSPAHQVIGVYSTLIAFNS